MSRRDFSVLNLNNEKKVLKKTKKNGIISPNNKKLKTE